MLPTVRARGGKHSRNEESNKESKESSKIHDNSGTFERAFGQDQFDYLRRLAAGLREKDDELRRKGQPGIKAIGVLGNDVFDKLLALRALKPLFPEAVFFTTDYDAALAGKEELEWTRNLIVASSFGPTLAGRLQKDIPPFRSTYQTSAFLATRIAAQEAGARQNEVLRDEITEGISSARIFEIDRQGQFAPLATTPQSVDSDKSADKSIHPNIPLIYPELPPKVIAGLCIALFLSASILSILCYMGMIFPFLHYTCWAFAVILTVSALLTLGWPVFAEVATERGMGERIAWTQGVSIWPSIALRAIAGILALCLVFDAWRELHRNLLKARARFFGRASRANWLKKSVRRQLAEVRRDRSSVSYSLPQKTDESQKIHVDEIWNAYVAKSALVPSALRISLYVLLMLTLFASLTAIFGPPNVPWRGELGKIYNFITIPVILLTLTLVFLVFDSTLLCLLFVDALRGHESKWPPLTHSLFKEKLEFEDPLLDEWLDLDFMAFRTKCISKLIYFPFAIFALLIVSRSTAFANFALSPPIIITQIVSFVIVFGCAMTLGFSAERARETVKTRLTKGLVAVKAADNSGKKVSQLETLLKLVDNLREGSFVPLSQQPPIRALLLPIGGLGWTALLDYRLLPGL